jgi:hypothetical protein
MSPESRAAIAAARPANARAFGHTLVTRDGELIPKARAGHLAAINCRARHAASPRYCNVSPCGRISPSGYGVKPASLALAA